MPSIRALLPAAFKPFLLAVAVALFVRLTICQMFSIPSDSMAPTLRKGDHVLVVPYDSWVHPRVPERGDIVVFREGGGRRYFIKRLVATGGDTVGASNGRLVVNGREIAEPYLSGEVSTAAFLPSQINRDLCFVMGDNRTDSIDSRQFGPIRRDQIVGQAELILWSSATETKGAGPGRRRFLAPLP